MALQTWLGPPRAQGLPRESGQPGLRLSPAPPGRPTLGTPASSWAVSVSLRPGWWPRALPLCDRNQLRRRLCLALPGWTLFRFPASSWLDLVSLGAPRVTDICHKPDLARQEVKHGRYFRDRRPRIETPVLSEREKGCQPALATSLEVEFARQAVDSGGVSARGKRGGRPGWPAATRACAAGSSPRHGPSS